MRTLQKLFIFCVCLVAFYACKKLDIRTLHSEDNTSLVKTTVQKFNDTYTNGASKANQEKMTTLLQKLDFKDAAIIPINDTSTLFVIRITENSLTSLEKGTKIAFGKFLSILEHNNQYSFDGIYEAKNINSIRSVYALRSLPANDYVFVRGLNNYPTKEWISNEDGILHYRENRSSSIGDIEKLKLSLKNTSSLEIRTSSMPEEEQPCIHWYWWEYYEGIGWQPVQFLYTTGCDGDGSNGGGGNSQNQALYCGIYTATDVAEMVTGAYLENIDTWSVAGGSIETDANGRIRQPRTPKWTIMQVPFGRFGGNYSFSAKYSGIRFRTSENDPTWKWESFSYSSFAGTWERQPCPIEITIKSVDHAEARKNDYTWDVAISFSADVRTWVPLIPVSNTVASVYANNKTTSIDATYN